MSEKELKLQEIVLRTVRALQTIKKQTSKMDVDIDHLSDASYNALDTIDETCDNLLDEIEEVIK